MLTELHIRQFALVDEIRLELKRGMTVFTGETGAGKSILVDAMGAVFGARASADWVRHGAKQAELSACIETDDARVLAVLEEQGIEDEGVLMLRRVINSDGRSRAWLNGVAVPLKVLQGIGIICLDLHGQHEHQALMDKQYQQQLIDQQVDAAVRQAVQHAYRELQAAQRALREGAQQLQQSREREAWLRQQLQATEQLELHPGVLAELEREVAAGSHIANIQQAAAVALDCVDDAEPSARALLAQASHAVAAMADVHPALQAAAEILQQADVLLSEVLPHLRQAESLELDANWQAAQEARLNQLQALLHQHRCDEAELIALQQDWQQQLDALETAAWDEEQRLNTLKQAQDCYSQAAQNLHQARVAAAEQLAAALRPWLDRLALKDMQIRIDVQAKQAPEAWQAHGWDTVVFMLSSNIGEPFKALQQVASGGELSRLVLSLKACGATTNSPAIAVFDEVDVGIGGETAWSIGELLAAMGRERQVLVVSHLAQVAAVADHHICISKVSDNERTRTMLTALDHSARQQELARMLGDASAQGVQQAQALQQRAYTMMKQH